MTPLFAHPHPGERSFERLYRTHAQDVYRYALMVLGHRADAEDVAQTTFLKAYRALRRGEQPRHPRQWLLAIAHNTCRTRLRDAKRRPQETSLDAELVFQEPPHDDGVDARELVRALGVLSFNQRSALVMRELEGRSYAEIAGLLGLSTSAVETLLFRARRAVREQLEGDLDCGAAERALSLQLDGRLDRAGRATLRAHLRECRECASLARRERARRAALRSLGPVSVPASLASWGGGATVGAGLGAKAAAVLAAGVAAASAGGSADAVAPRPAAERPATVLVARRHEAPQLRLAGAVATPPRPAPAAAGPAAPAPPASAPAAEAPVPAPVPAGAPEAAAEAPARPVEPAREPLAVPVPLPAVPVPVPEPAPLPEVPLPEPPPAAVLPVELPEVPPAPLPEIP